MKFIRGTVVVEGRSLTLALEVGAEDLIHTQKLAPASDGLFVLEQLERAAGAHGQALRRRIVLRDARGEVIDGRVGSWKLDDRAGNRVDLDTLGGLYVHYTIEYELNRADRYLSFQQVTRDAGLVLRPTMVLAVRGDGVSPQTVRLTRGGNVEIVRLSSTNRDDLPNDRLGVVDGPGCRFGSFVLTESQRTIRAIVRIHDTGVRVELFIPVPLLETWRPIARSRRDFLEIEDQLRSQAEIKRFIAAHNPLSLDGRRVTEEAIEGVAGARETAHRVEFLDVGEFGGVGTSPSRRLGAWTSRVHITTDYHSSGRPTTLDLQWTLFNASILTGHAMILVDGDCLEHDFSTYNPHLIWKRDSAGTTTSGDDR